MGIAQLLASVALFALVLVMPSTAESAAARVEGTRPEVSRRAQNAAGGNTSPVNATRPQGQAPNQGQPGGQAAPEIEIESSHSYVLDAAILVLLYGGTLFIICRSAGRV